jgi:hypothetical protein
VDHQARTGCCPQQALLNDAFTVRPFGAVQAATSRKLLLHRLARSSRPSAALVHPDRTRRRDDVSPVHS